VADVLEAVTYVAGVDPLTDNTYRDTMRSRRLACHALREISECSFPAIGRALGYADHTSVVYHCGQPVDYDELRAVLNLVAEKVSVGHRIDLLDEWPDAERPPEGGRTGHSGETTGGLPRHRH
jgi:hypothetical protein